MLFAQMLHKLSCGSQITIKGIIIGKVLRFIAMAQFFMALCLGIEQRSQCFIEI